MTELNELVESYKREVAPPGGFAAAFPNATDADIIGALADGFSQAQLEGFFSTSVLDLDDNSVTPDLSNAGRSLVVIYAGMRSVRSQLLSVKTSVRYKAGPTEYEVQTSSASLLTEMMRDLRARRDALLELARVAARGQTTYVYDNYMARVAGDAGFYSGELPVAIGGI